MSNYYAPLQLKWCKRLEASLDGRRSRIAWLVITSESLSSKWNKLIKMWTSLLQLQSGKQKLNKTFAIVGINIINIYLLIVIITFFGTSYNRLYSKSMSQMTRLISEIFSWRISWIFWFRCLRFCLSKRKTNSSVTWSIGFSPEIFGSLELLCLPAFVQLRSSNQSLQRSFFALCNTTNNSAKNYRIWASNF